MSFHENLFTTENVNKSYPNTEQTHELWGSQLTRQLSLVAYARWVNDVRQINQAAFKTSDL